MPMVESPFEEVGPHFRPVQTWRVADEEPPPPLSPRARRRRRNIAGSIAAVVLLLLGLWWCNQPRSYHRVATIAGVDVAIFPCLQRVFIARVGEYLCAA